MSACAGVKADGSPCRFAVAEGREWCTWHDPERSPDEKAAIAAKGGRPRATLPPGTEAPVFKTRESIVAWAEVTARLVLVGALDPKIADTARGLADLAMRAHELAALDRLDKLERVIGGKARRSA